MRILYVLIASAGVLVGLQDCHSPTDSTQSYDNIEILYLHKSAGASTILTVRPGEDPTVLVENGAWNDEAAYLPGDTAIIFTSRVDSTGEPANLYRMPLAGGVPQQLTTFTTSVYDLQMTPDGENIVFQVDPTEPSIWRYHLPTGETTRLQDDGLLLDIGSDQGRLLFATRRAGIYEDAKWMPAMGGPVQNLPIYPSRDVAFFQNETQVIYSQTGYVDDTPYAKAVQYQFGDRGATEFPALPYCARILTVGPQGQVVLYQTERLQAEQNATGVNLYVAQTGTVETIDIDYSWYDIPRFTDNGQVFVYTDMASPGVQPSRIMLWDISQGTSTHVLTGSYLAHADIRMLD